MVITTFIDLTRTTMVYRLAYMKKSGNRLFRYPDFVNHYNNPFSQTCQQPAFMFFYLREFIRLPVGTTLSYRNQVGINCSGKSMFTGWLMRACTQTVCFSNMENNEMNNTDTLEKIIRHQKNKDPAYPFREHLLMQLCIRTNKRMQDNISEFLGAYGINHSAYMVLTTLFAAENR